MSSIIAALVGHHTLPEWPPKLSDEQIATLLLESSTYALGHGFTLLPPHPASGAPPAPTHAIAAPLSLFPSPFPREEYERAKSLQVAYNALYARVALDWAFLDRVMGQVAQVDEFQAELWFRWKSIRDDLVQVRRLYAIKVDRSLCNWEYSAATTFWTNRVMVWLSSRSSSTPLRLVSAL